MSCSVVRVRTYMETDVCKQTSSSYMTIRMEGMSSLQLYIYLGTFECSVGLLLNHFFCIYILGYGQKNKKKTETKRKK